MFAKYWLSTCVFVLITLFLYTALTKIWDQEIFRGQLSVFPYLHSFAGILTWLIPVAELLVCALLFIEYTRLQGLYASLVLMTLFTVYLLAMVLTVPGLPCSCGGIIQAMSWPQHLVFNLCIIAMTLFATNMAYRKRLSEKRF